jgi:lipid-A-disaccharide synthase
MLEAVKKYKNYQIVISGALGIEVDYYHQFMDDERIPVTMSQTPQLLLQADLAIVNSGTATLETALAGTPQIVVYHVMFGRLAYWLKPLLIKTKYISLVNILAGKEVVKELYAHLFTSKLIQAELDKIIGSQEYKTQMIENYHILAASLGEPGSFIRAVDKILEDFK